MYLVQPLHAQEKGGKATIILLYFEIPATGWRVLSTVYSSVLNLPWLLWLLALNTAHLLSMWLPPSNRNGQCLGSALSFQVPSSTEVSSQVHSQRQVSQNFKMCCESCRCQLWSPEPRATYGSVSRLDNYWLSTVELRLSKTLFHFWHEGRTVLRSPVTSWGDSQEKGNFSSEPCWCFHRTSAMTTGFWEIFFCLVSKNMPM